MSDETIGFIGLGIMGLPMSKNLLDAGYSVVGHNRSDGPTEELVEYGGEDGGSPAGVAEASDVVLLCLPDSPDVEQVILGNDDENTPVVDGLSEGMTLIDHSTISPTVTQSIATDLEKIGVTMLDAPISGGEEGAIEGSLSIMVGGDEDALNEHTDILGVVGETVTHCGPSGAGQTTKAANQIVVAAQMVGVSEALVFADRAGADLEAVVDAISGGAAGCWTLDNRAPNMIQDAFEPGFFAKYQYKDLKIATDAGEAFGAPMPHTGLAHELYKTMIQNDMGYDDNSGVMQVLQMMAGKASTDE
ncbi:NAD(P)-dependent oxidoreductase [Haladaptatus pallidirubidus]|uniref:NAD(P)-dependent oxidoreductase n=2 Tax=Haladaptatus pallidirubidus TaxID=1008152 RepID=A0AAV3UJ56_9EURY